MRLLDRYSGGSPDDPHVRAQLHTRLIAAVGIGTMSGAWTLVSLAVGHYTLAGTCAVALLGCLAVLSLLRRGSDAAAPALVLVFAAALTLGGVHRDGDDNSMLVWLLLIPAIANAVGGYRLAARSTPLVLVVLGIWNIVDALGLSQPGLGFGAWTHAWSNTLSALSLGVALAGSLSWANRSLQRSLSQQLRERREAELRALEARDAQQRFLAVMSHEIRTPLNGVLGIAELLSHTELDEGQARYVQTIARSGSGLLSVVNDVLDFAKCTSDELELEDGDVVVEELVHDLDALFAGKAQMKGLRLGSRVLPHVPRVAAGDPLRLRQILINLVSNALKFTHTGVVELTADWNAADASLVFEVRDSGIGMTPGAIGRIFDPFKQADLSTTRRYGGTGLGLAICHRLVVAMGGSITVESQPGVGTTFRLVVPSEVRSRCGERPSIVDSGAFHALGRTALVVDDNPVNRMVAKGLLLHMGFSVHEASDGAQATVVFDRVQPDLVLMDFYMPEVDGFEATTTLRRSSTVPIIGVSASVTSEDEARARAVGMSATVPKPIDVTILRNTIARLLEPGARAAAAK